MLTGFKNKRIALIGDVPSNAFSIRLHGILADYSFEYIDVKKSQLKQILADASFDGYVITSPLKEVMMPYVDEASELCTRTGHVTAALRRDGKLYGFNHEYGAFLYLLKVNHIDPAGKKVLVLGPGPSQNTVAIALSDLGADDVVEITDGGENDYSSIDMHDDAALIINTTKIGMAPDFTSSPISLRYFKGLEGVVDLIYDPFRTELMLTAEEYGIPAVGGLDMLMSHAKASCELFTGKKVTDYSVAKASAGMEAEMKNIVLVGMPGCGKSVIAKELAKALGREAIDTDDEVSHSVGLGIPEIFELFGEERFRQKESEIIRKAARGSGAVIATGAGAILHEDNIKEIRRKSVVVFLRREIERLATSSERRRSRDALMKLYKERIPLYLAASDVIVDVGETPRDTVRSIVKAIYKK